MVFACEFNQRIPMLVIYVICEFNQRIPMLVIYVSDQAMLKTDCVVALGG